MGSSGAWAIRSPSNGSRWKNGRSSTRPAAPARTGSFMKPVSWAGLDGDFPDACGTEEHGVLHVLQQRTRRCIRPARSAQSRRWVSSSRRISVQRTCRARRQARRIESRRRPDLADQFPGSPARLVGPTSFATGLPARALAIFSPSAALSTNRERWAFAPWLLMVVIRPRLRLDPERATTPPQA